jgi:hypothetical protein
MPYTREELEYLNASSFPTNNAGQIDANRLKTYNNAVIDGAANTSDTNQFLADQEIAADLNVQYTGSFGYLIAPNINTSDNFNSFTASYLATSASFNTRININSSSAAGKSQFDASQVAYAADSASVSTRLVSLENGEYIITSSIFGAYTGSTNAFTASITASVAALLASSGSYVTKTTFGNFTQSYNVYTQSTNDWLADLTIHTSSYATVTQLNTKLDTSVYNANNVQINAFTASTKTRLDNLEVFSASAAVNFVTQSLFGLSTASLQAATASLNAFSASTNLFTASLKATTASLNLFSASVLSYTQSINNKTSSFATTGSNSWSGSQVISGSLTITGSVYMSGPIFEGFTQVTYYSGALSLTENTPTRIGSWSSASYGGLTIDYLDTSVSQSAIFGTSSIKNTAQVVFGAGGWDTVIAPFDFWVASGSSPLTASSTLYAVPNLYINDQYQRIFGAGYNVGSGNPSAATPRGPVFSGSFNSATSSVFELWAYYPWNALQSNFKAKITAF